MEKVRPSLANLEAIDDIVQQLAERVSRAEQPILVRGPTGSGRTTIGRELERTLGRRAVLVQWLPPTEADAVTHALFYSASHSGAQAMQVAKDESRTVQQRARIIGGMLRESNRSLVVWLPDSWRAEQSIHGNAFEHLQAKRVNSLLKGLLHSRVRVLVLAPMRTTLPRELANCESQLLEPISIRAQALDETSWWGSYEPFAKQVADEINRRQAKITPLQYRLAVGLVALGERPRDLLANLVSETARDSSTLVFVSNRLRETLRRPWHSQLREAVLNLLRARQSLPRDVAVSIASPPAGHEPFITDCIAYGEDRVRVADFVRSSLLPLRATDRGQKGPQPHRYQSTHQRLAQYHAEQDGSRQVPLEPVKTSHWVEKVHHTAHSGNEKSWSELELPTRDLYWDRARALSIEEGAFEAAARVYKSCIERFGDDAYSWHYWSFNTRRAKKNPEAVEHGYRKAVELEPTHRWYNGRLVCLLIEQGRFVEADEAWTQGLQRLTGPDIRRVRPENLALDYYRWVAKAWVRAGEVKRARAAFDRIPASLTENVTIRMLAHELADAEEARALGESVYAADVPMDQRWRPRVVPEELNTGAKLQRFYPGRIVDVSSSDVTMALGVKVEGGDTHLMSRKINRVQWQEYCAASPQPGGFVEVGTYDNEEVLIVPAAASSNPSTGDYDEEDFMAFAHAQ